MADRYQDRRFQTDQYDRASESQGSAQGEADPLAELARLIGQTDPFGAMGRANHKPQPRSSRDHYEEAADTETGPSAGPPPWMQRTVRQEPAADDFRQAEHPLRRYAAPAPEPNYEEAQPHDPVPQQSDSGRYDEALYGPLDSAAQESRYDQSGDPYGYPEGYGEEAEDEPAKRRGGMGTVFIVLTMAVLGTGAAFAYRTYFAAPRSGEPPIIRADNSPTKIVPTPSDGTAKMPDRLASGDGAEKIVPREEAPVDVNARSGPRVVFPPLNQNANPPSPASVTPVGSPLASVATSTLPNSEPRKIKTFSVRGDQPDGATPGGAVPPKPASAAKSTTAAAMAAPRNQDSPAGGNANANAPLSLMPQTIDPVQSAPATRVAAGPVQTAPAAATGAGGYLVQVSSQRSEADAQASYRVLQGKYPNVLGSRAPVIKRADLGEKGVYYRAMVGPFGSPEEASQFCGNLKTAGAPCVVQRN